MYAAQTRNDDDLRFHRALPATIRFHNGGQAYIVKIKCVESNARLSDRLKFDQVEYPKPVHVDLRTN